MDVFNRDAGKDNNSNDKEKEKEKVYAKSGSSFFNNMSNSGIGNKTNDEFINLNNNTNTNSNFNRRRSNLFPESNDNLSSQQDESESRSNNSYKRADRKNTSSPVNVHQDANEDDGMSNVYVPSLSRNSRVSLYLLIIRDLGFRKRVYH